jgi:protein phosphatase/serine/threonine-protein phosphatase Stp1
MSRTILSWSATHPGTVRTQNQDACLCRPEIGLFAVADGVGGHSGGEIASARVIETLSLIAEDLPPIERLAAVRAGLQDTHRALLETAMAPGATITPATTIVALLLHEGHFACLWAGDSRAYLLRDGQLCALTTDHSVVQDLVSAGALTAAEAEHDPRQHVITRAIGAGTGDLQIAKSVGQVLPGDRFLLCSDGLYKALELDRIADGLASGSAATENVAEQLIREALAHAARDNVTAVVALP